MTGIPINPVLPNSSMNAVIYLLLLSSLRSFDSTSVTTAVIAKTTMAAAIMYPLSFKTAALKSICMASTTRQGHVILTAKDEMPSLCAAEIMSFFLNIIPGMMRRNIITSDVSISEITIAS